SVRANAVQDRGRTSPTPRSPDQYRKSHGVRSAKVFVGRSKPRDQNQNSKDNRRSFLDELPANLAVADLAPKVHANSPPLFRIWESSRKSKRPRSAESADY